MSEQRIFVGDLVYPITKTYSNPRRDVVIDSEVYKVVKTVFVEKTVKGVDPYWRVTASLNLIGYSSELHMAENCFVKVEDHEV